ncbi:MAG: hypothetical protein IJN67_01360 [Oscillospiraceae bacterium]|nr:hypothetical protein [Oscillospiraceae bacterium]
MAKNKLYSIILSVVVAFALWLYVINNVSEKADWHFYNIPVVRAGESVLSERNLMITDISSNVVSLHLSGTRNDLNKIDEKNTSVRIDLSNIKEPGEKIPLNFKPSYPSDVSSGDLEVLDQNPEAIYVSVDYRRTAEIPVQVKWKGTRSEDYIYDTENAVLDYPTITIMGPAAVADRIHHAEIEVDLTGKVESISESFRYTLCDAHGDPVDAQSITTNAEEIRLNAQIQRIKEIRLVADVVYGGGATALNTTVNIEPSVIRVSGGEAVLAELGDKLTVCTINMAEIEKSGGFEYTVSLPDGVTNQTGVSEVTVSVRFAGLKAKEFVVENFEIINLPDGMAAEIINANLTVKVRGPESEIGALTQEDITAVVDFSNAEVGTATYKATITFNEKFPNVGALKTSSVSATVQLAGEE